MTSDIQLAAMRVARPMLDLGLIVLPAAGP